MKERMHERDYTFQGFRRHMKLDHGKVIGSVKLSSFISHRRLHDKGYMKVEHTHSDKQQSKGWGNS